MNEGGLIGAETDLYGFWGHLLAILGHLWGQPEPSWDHVRSILGPFRVVLRAILALWGRLGAIVGNFWR